MSEQKREKVFLNGYEYWLDREKQVLYDKEDAINGVYYSDDGVSIWSSHLTKNERQQLLNHIRYNLPS